MGVVTHKGDAVKWARKYKKAEKPLFHALLCDAPYEMDFMGKGWDGTGVAFDPDTWEAFAGVLHPGAFLFVFAGTINDDLISVAMRKAGLRKFHKIMGWAYGSGFPKASRIDTQIDKAKRRDYVAAAVDLGLSIPGNSLHDWTKAEHSPSDIWWERFKKVLSPDDWKKIERELISNEHKKAGWFTDGDDYDITTPATPLAQAWEGHRYGLQALKPAIETILVFQKPYEGKPIDDITRTGAGALNIEGGRIGTDGSDYLEKSGRPGGGEPGNGGTMGPGWNNPLTHATPAESGRWPSNFLLLDAEAAARLDEQSGERGAGYRSNPSTNKSTWFGAKDGTHIEGERGYTDSGGASRFFFRVSAQIDDADPVYYCAKASRKERDAGCETLPLSHMGERPGRDNTINSKKDLRYENRDAAITSPSRNPHPTVKPLSLTRYLATLLLPPALYAPRRLFVPFAGVGSEQIGGALAGWEEIEGVEVTEEYIPINRARVNYWTLKPKEPIEKSNGSKARSNGHKKANQLELI
jgi:hypothetical protein